MHFFYFSMNYHHFINFIAGGDCLTHMQCNVSLCNGDSVRPSVRPSGWRGKNFNVGYISLNIRGRLLIFGIHIDHMDLYPPDL